MKTALLTVALAAIAAAQPNLRLHKGQPHVSSQQDANVDALKNDLAAIKSKSQITPAMKQKLAADLMAMADGATKPSQSSVNKLVNDFTAAMSDQSLSHLDIVKLTNDFHQVLNSANISTAEFNAVVADAQTLLQASGFTKSDAQTVAADLKAIGAEAQKNATAAAGRIRGRVNPQSR